MKKCEKKLIDHELPGLDLNKLTPFFKKEDLLKAIFTEHSQLLKAYSIKLGIKVVQVGGEQPCVECDGTEFLRTGTCHVCVACGASQGCS